MYYEYQVKPNLKRPGNVMLKPTWRAYAKAFAPVLAIYAVLGVFVTASMKDWAPDLDSKDEDTTSES